MKLERTKNAGKGIVYGMLLKIYQIFVPFLLRTALVYYLGIEYLGLSSLFTSILSVLSLAELGVGSAMVFSMYQPIAEDDAETICALMKLYKIYYRVIGIIIFIMGLVITPFIPHFVKSDLPQGINIYIIYFISLMGTVLSYWLFAYKNSLLSAHQRTDITSKITIVANTILYIVQFIVLVILKNYYIYILTTLVAQILSNIITAIIVDKMYPEYKPIGELDSKKKKIINRKIKDLFTAKLGGTITNSADTLVISSFLGLATLAIYNNYFYIVSSIIGFVAIGFNACMAGIGNSIVLESKEKNYHDFEKMFFIFVWVITVCSCCFLNLFQPFMKMWMGEKYMLSNELVICFVLYFIVYEINAFLNLFKDAAGIWHQDRFRPLVVSLSNLALNLLSVKFIGLYGVLISTVLTMAFIGIPWIIKNLFKNLFKKEREKKFMFDLIKKLIVVVIIIAGTHVICNLIPAKGIIAMIVYGLVSVMGSILVLMIIYSKTQIFTEVITSLKALK